MAYLDLVGFINTQEPVASWISAKKQEFLDRFCAARGYTGNPDEEGNSTQTKKEFVNEDVLNYIRLMCEDNARKEAEAAVTYEEFDFNA